MQYKSESEIDERENGVPYTTSSRPRGLSAPFVDGELCERCKNIDFEAIFHPANPVPPEEGRPILELGSITSRSRCSVCRLFAAVRFSGPQRLRVFHIRLYSKLSLVGEIEEEGHKKKWAGVGLSVLRTGGIRDESSSDLHNFSDNTSFTDKGFILPAIQRRHPHIPRPLFAGFQINERSVSYVRIQEWLSDCQSLLSKTCGLGESSLPVQLKCIHCNTREIVQIESSDEYFCLSYVWGVTNSESQDHMEENRGRLPSNNVPQVIEDAMIVVKELGMRYLWVDRYCINQRDHDGKDLQIRNMDSIYGSAYATIVASAGPDAAFGLPGVGRTPRKGQPSAVAGNQILVSTLPPLSRALKDSAWIKRGWTYQEAILSRRCLFFTEEQVYFVCRAMTQSESIVNEASQAIPSAKKASLTTLRADVFGLPRLRTIKNCSKLRELADHITEYSRRQLTYEKDILDAFRGLLERSHFPSYFGLAIVATESPGEMTEDMEWSRGLASALYWTPHGIGGWDRTWLDRQPGFPSWSWTGWRGAVEYLPKSGPCYHRSGEEGLLEFETTCFDTKIWVENNNGNLTVVEHLSRSDPGTKLISELSNYLVLEAWVFQFRFWPHQDESMAVCRCHPNAIHQGPFQFEDRVARFYTDELLYNHLYKRLTTELWDCILLFSNKDSCYLIVIEWVGDTARRIGTILAMENFDGLKRFPKRRQRIRLG